MAGRTRVIMFHLLLPLCVHWIAEEMTVSVLVDVITDALCPGDSTCTQAIYLNGLQQTADVVEDSKRAAAFSWITGLSSASHVLGNLLALFLPEKYIFPVSIALLIFSPVYMQFFLVETVKLAPNRDQDSACLTWTMEVLHKRYKSMRHAARVVISSPTLRGISLVSFFYELGMSGITGVLWALFYGLAWAAWVPYMSASIKVIVVLIRPFTYAIISQASSSNNQDLSLVWSQ